CASWSRTRIYACIAAFARSGVLRERGTCRSPPCGSRMQSTRRSETTSSGKKREKQGKRLRSEACERQRYGLRERELAAHEGDFPHGRARDRQEFFPVEYLGPADLVRSQSQQGRISRPFRRGRCHGRDECTHLRARHARGERRRDVDLRLDVAA